eukprot:s279_g7.t1
MTKFIKMKMEATEVNPTAGSQVPVKPKSYAAPKVNAKPKAKANPEMPMSSQGLEPRPEVPWISSEETNQMFLWGWGKMRKMRKHMGTIRLLWLKPMGNHQIATCMCSHWPSVFILETILVIMGFVMIYMGYQIRTLHGQIQQLHQQLNEIDESDEDEMTESELTEFSPHEDMSPVHYECSDGELLAEVEQINRNELFNSISDSYEPPSSSEMRAFMMERTLRRLDNEV